MKYKLLATCVGAAVLAGCGSDSTSSSSIQAYDGAISGFEGTFICYDDDGVQTDQGTLTETNSDGFGFTSNLSFTALPGSCVVEFADSDGNAVDTSNGKSMSNVSYKIPRGLAKNGGAATPITTLIANYLGDGVDYNESAGSEIITALGLGSIVGTYVTLDELLTNPAAAFATVKSEAGASLYKKLVATTQVLSDVLATGSITDVTDITTVTSNLSDLIVADDSIDFDDVYVDVTGILDDDEYVAALSDSDFDADDNADLVADVSASTETATPVDGDDDDDDDDATGGTGSGSGSSGGSTGA
ncbi:MULTISPECIES: hypothetical protein [unclassified Vibrio]|uniref:Serine/threonine protein kinase n=1 Tax=Vibrio sp. HB236076 TaxID=3232307 RepID=A0AB39HFE9_9VIBR|nr:hypothetical protein [Vibrio sp. HB161653]MDP5255391.1 hypothetical protein [Vibrio sp. HB161653]